MLKDYVEALRQVTEYYGIPVVDLYATSGIQPKLAVNKDTYCPDGLHPNEAERQLRSRQHSLLGRPLLRRLP